MQPPSGSQIRGGRAAGEAGSNRKSGIHLVWLHPAQALCGLSHDWMGTEMRRVMPFPFAPVTQLFSLVANCVVATWSERVARPGD
jgi:hypothetical protein